MSHPTFRQLALLFGLLLALAGCDDDGEAGGAVDAGGQGGSSGAGGGGGAAGGAGGMGGGGEGGAGGEAGAGGEMSCATDADCGAGAVCFENACRPACGADDDCGPDGVCDRVNAVCVRLERCGADRSCPDGAVCNCRGRCEPAEGNPCQRDLQCAVDAFCDPCAGVCKARVEPCGRCTESAACAERNDLCQPLGEQGLSYCLRACAGQDACDRLGPGFECVDIGDGTTACVPRSRECGQVGDCAVDADCGPGAFCNERLFCQPACEDDTGCPNGTVCQGLRCEPPCTADADCGPGGECDDTGHCRVPGGCVTSADCPEPETYCDTEQQLCVPGCEVDNDCLDATKECINGSCRERGCAANFQCAFGQVCELDSAQCVEAQGRHCEEGCDPMDEASCGDTARCLSLQDEEENPLGDFCFERCLEEPNECPQGYRCTELMDQDGNLVDTLCIRRCDQSPI